MLLQIDKNEQQFPEYASRIYAVSAVTIRETMKRATFERAGHARYETGVVNPAPSLAASHSCLFSYEIDSDEYLTVRSFIFLVMS